MCVPYFIQDAVTCDAVLCTMTKSLRHSKIYHNTVFLLWVYSSL